MAVRNGGKHGRGREDALARHDRETPHLTDSPLERHLCGMVGGYTGCEGRRGRLFLSLRVVRRYLALVLVEIESGVKLRLLRKQLLQARSCSKGRPSCAL